ncbi:phosphoenolpyruvate--protein phosphotransferase [Chloroflexi bacterium TSY]|nr:phosphoenolpyruvate--protein phosphotransferase [Chloroflexi bacterium TSY]
MPAFIEQTTSDPDVECTRLMQALAAVRRDLKILQQQMTENIGADEAAIFEAQRFMLDDPELLELFDKLLDETGLNAEAVWQRAIDATSQNYMALEDNYLRERAIDLEDAGRRVLRHFDSKIDIKLELAEPSIIVASTLHPSDAAQLPVDQVLGLLLEQGSVTDHSAILARSLGIPVVVGLGPLTNVMKDGELVGMDGSSGRVWVSPTSAEVESLQSQRAAWIAKSTTLLERAKELAYTQDGHHIEVVANMGNPSDAQAALQYGAEGVGLFRTEFLFMNRDVAPDESEQLEAYRAVAQALHGASVIIRTLDIGGDKPIPYLNQTSEENPFLGLRGIRFCLKNVALFKTQLRAMLRASAEQNIRIMFPMVSTLEELQQAKELLVLSQEELQREGIPFKQEIQVGVMIETPAVIWSADQLAAEVDFFSIGTNDLTQYMMAADRGNSQVSELVISYQPAILRAIEHVIKAAQQANIPVGVCGELAGNPDAAPLLIGLGVSELSMNGSAIPSVKQRIRSFELSEMQAIAQKALRCETATQVEALLTQIRETQS